MSARLLIVDDDRFLLENLRRFFLKNGYDAETAASGEDALAMLDDTKVDLAILDVGLPGMDGVALCRRLRTKWRFPVIMLTARSESMDKVVGLEVGADDYLTKPFQPVELLARVRAQLRRAREYSEASMPNGEDRIVVGDLQIDFGRRQVLVEGRPADLTNREFELLAYLAKNRDVAVPRDSLFESIWGYDIDFNSNSLEVYVYRIRKKIEKDPLKPRYLLTLRGYGYKFHAAESDAA
ncbi:MAG TPA: response regulator transcription factor [Fimbriimonadaceae bacterium]|nr:response regulator transcription factor [Fimbriimonadaceae bacterium]HRJ96983.1 response regulator transcription factor [Fimbriimonadaceae bacterium]